MRRTALVVLSLATAACTADAPTTASDTQAATVCAAGPTVAGIDVSYYQGTIDWAAVAGDGIQFAFIRTTDGTGYLDSKYDANRAGARAAGVLRGTYQFFRPGQDPIAQADLLLSRMGNDPDDLPPVIDVEASDGVSAAGVAAAVQQWVDHVEAALGRRPIIYTGRYFWSGSVGNAPMGDYPLWIANWGVSCPNLPDPWASWAFWQDSDSGSVAGISGAVDTDLFNGDLAALAAFGGTIECGDGVCSLGESTDTCEADCPPCGVIDATGGVIDDVDACFHGGGPSQYLRTVTDAGYDSSLVWTHTTDDATEANFGQWTLYLAEAGQYRVEVYTAAAYAQSTQARYQVRHAGVVDEVVVDQTAADGWQALGDFDLGAGGDQWVHVGDNTGEPVTGNVQLVFDAVRLTRLDAPPPPGPDAGPGDDPGAGDASGGCAAGGGDGGLLGLVLIGGALTRVRRARHR